MTIDLQSASQSYGLSVKYIYKLREDNVLQSLICRTKNGIVASTHMFSHMWERKRKEWLPAMIVRSWPDASNGLVYFHT